MALMELLLPFGVRRSPALAVAKSCLTLRLHERQASLSITNSWSLLKLMSVESVIPSNHLILCLPFPYCSQSFPASGSFPRSQFFASGGQNIGASASVLQMNIQDWFPLGLTSLISLLSRGLSRVFSSTTTTVTSTISAHSIWTLKSLLQHHSSKASVLQRSAFFIVQLSHPYMTTGKTIVLTRWTFVGEVMPYLHPYLFALYSLRPLSDLENHCYCFFKYFLIWTIFKVFIEFVKYCFSFMFCFLTLRHVGF